jgi:hypothetical protein
MLIVELRSEGHHQTTAETSTNINNTPGEYSAACSQQTPWNSANVYTNSELELIKAFRCQFSGAKNK